MNIDAQMEMMAKMNEFLRAEKLLKYFIHSLGLLGQLLLFYVYLQKSFTKLSLSVYMRCMAIVCMGQNIYYLCSIELANSIFDTSDITYKLINFLANLFIPISVWLEVASSLDRFLTIVFPTRFHFIQKRVFQRATVAFIVVFNMAFYSCILFKIHVYTHDIDFNDQIGFVNTLQIMNLVNNSAIPFVVMFVLSLATAVGVLRAHRRIKSQSSSGHSRTSAQRTFIRDIKFGSTLIVLNVVFFIFSFLNYLNITVGISPFSARNTNYASFLFSLILTYLSEYYFSINFYLQFAVNSLVRRELLNMLSRCFRAYPCST